jgi:hypothetical protein
MHHGGEDWHELAGIRRPDGGDVMISEQNF